MRKLKGKISKTGYKDDSPDKDNDVNIIPSRHITMRGVSTPVLGIDNLGNRKLMTPGNDYVFPGDFVTEYPKRKLKGGGEVYMSDEEIEKQNQDYFLSRVKDIGLHKAVKEYNNVFKTGKRKSYSIR